MKRENRYTVLKDKDVKKYLNEADYTALVQLLAKVADGREGDGKPELSCVVVESDWPEYESVWKMIEARVAGGVNQPKTDEQQPAMNKDVSAMTREELENVIGELRLAVIARAYRDLSGESLDDSEFVVEAMTSGSGYYAYAPKRTATRGIGDTPEAAMEQLRRMLEPVNSADAIMDRMPVLSDSACQLLRDVTGASTPGSLPPKLANPNFTSEDWQELAVSAVSRMRKAHVYCADLERRADTMLEAAGQQPVSKALTMPKKDAGQEQASQGTTQC